MWKLTPEQMQHRACEYHLELSYLTPFDYGTKTLNQTILKSHLQRFVSREKQLFIDDKKYEHTMKICQSHHYVAPLDNYVKDNFVRERMYRVKMERVLSLFRENKRERALRSEEQTFWRKS